MGVRYDSVERTLVASAEADVVQASEQYLVRNVVLVSEEVSGQTKYLSHSQAVLLFGLSYERISNTAFSTTTGSASVAE